MPTHRPTPTIAPKGLPGPRVISGHYWEGAVYNGASTTATQLSTYITTPDDTPDASNFYYVLLSVWDSAGSYDQIGFSNSNSVWGLTYSWTTHCAGTYYYSPDIQHLDRGTTYNFSMTIASGELTFAVYGPGGTLVWSQRNDTGGDDFVIENTYSTCSSLDYTDYEEAYDTTQNVPSYDLFFPHNLIDGAPETDWTPFNSGGPTSVAVAISANDVTVENQPFALSFVKAGGDWGSVGLDTTVYATQFNLTYLAADGTITFASECLTGGWATSFTPVSASATSTVTLSVTIPAGTTAGTYCVRVNATDPNGEYTLIRLNLTLSASLDPTLTASPAGIDVNDSTVYTLSDSPCGTAAASCLGYFSAGAGNAWHACVASPTSTSRGIAYGTVGNFTASGTVAEYSAPSCGGYLMTNGTLTSNTVTVNPDPVLSISSTRLSVDVNQLVTFRVNVVGGTPAYAYDWTSLPAGCSNSGNPSDACVPTQAGPFNVTVSVKDATGYLVNRTASFTVYSDPSEGLPTATPGSGGIDANQWVNFTSAAPTGGHGTYTYDWVEAPEGCRSLVTPVLACQPAVAGQWSVQVQVTDGNNDSVASPVLNYTVLSDPSPSGVHASRTRADVGQSIALSATSQGGSGRNTYTWLGLPTGCSSSDALTIPCLPTEMGTFTVRLQVEDSNGFIANRSNGTPTVLTISPVLAISGFAAQPSSVEVGQATNFSVNVSGGRPSYSFVYSGLPTGCATTDAAAFRCAPTASGTFPIQLTVTDANGASLNASTVLTVGSSTPRGGGGSTPSGGLGLWWLFLLGAVVLIVGIAVLLSRKRRAPPAQYPPGPAPYPPSQGAYPLDYGPTSPGSSQPPHPPPT